MNTVLSGISPLGYVGVPRTPILFYHAVHDQFAPIAEMEQLAARFCDEGISVGITTSPDGDHISYVSAGFPTALQYITDRFRGEAAPNDCQEPVDAAAAGDAQADASTADAAIAVGSAVDASSAGASSTGASTTDADAVGASAAKDGEATTGTGHSSGCGCAVDDHRSSKGTVAVVLGVAMLFSRRRRFRSSGALDF